MKHLNRASSNHKKSILFIIFHVLIIFPTLTIAQTTCQSLFEKNLTQEKMQALLTKKRIRSIKKTKISNIQVNQVIYKIIGLLGESSSQVYLGVSPQNEKVIIKHLKETDEVSAEWINSIYYEMAVTKYYLSHKMTVPDIIDYEIVSEKNNLREGFLVKQYYEGFTRDEFQEGRGMSFLYGSKYTAMSDALTQAMAAAVETHKGFRQWLNQNNINLYKHPFSNLKSLIERGDHNFLASNNWLFSPKLNQWVLYDP